MAELRIEGFDELLRALERMPEVGVPLMTRAMERSLLLLVSPLRKYPDATEGNRARTFQPGGDNTWYERGYGPRWARKDGTVGGKKTSRNLGKQWATRTRIFAQGSAVLDVKGPVIEGVAGNTTFYVDYVQGDAQQPWHKRHGWVTVDQALDEATPGIYKQFDDAVAELTEGFNEEKF